MSQQRAILLYDGYCIFCIRIVKFLEVIGSTRFHSYKKKLRMKPYQKSASLIQKYSLSPTFVGKKIHLIDRNGIVYKGTEAVARLGYFFPILRPFFVFFKTALGRGLYSIIARNRRKIFGCSEACYISKTFP